MYAIVQSYILNCLLCHYSTNAHANDFECHKKFNKICLVFLYNKVTTSPNLFGKYTSQELKKKRIPNIFYE